MEPSSRRSESVQRDSAIPSVTADWARQPPRPLLPGEAHLYFMRIDHLAEPPASLYALLDAAERERCARYAFVRNRIESTAARALARSTLSRYASVAATSSTVWAVAS